MRVGENIMVMIARNTSTCVNLCVCVWNLRTSNNNNKAAWQRSREKYHMHCCLLWKRARLSLKSCPHTVFQRNNGYAIKRTCCVTAGFGSNESTLEKF